MGKEIDLLSRYPKTKRNLKERIQQKTESVRRVAREFGFEYFDGDRNHGYGGFFYDAKYWSGVVQDIITEYGLDSDSRVLDVGCAKGFFLFDLKNALPGIEISGIDISSYAINSALPEIKSCLTVGSASNLPYPDNYFDFVISVNTIHNLDLNDCKKALTEIERVSKGFSFVTVDAYRNEEEKRRMEAWNLTALTMMSDSEWKVFFKDAGYTGDYYWFIP